MFEGIAKAFTRRTSAETQDTHPQPGASCQGEAAGRDSGETGGTAACASETSEPAGDGTRSAAHRVLLIGANEVGLEQCRQTLSQANPDWTVEVVTHWDAVWERLTQGACDVVVTDPVLGERSGADLLGEMSQRCPDVRGFVRLGRAAEERAARAPQSSLQIIEGDWQDEALAERLQRVLWLEQCIPAEGLNRLLGNIRELPSLPTLYHQVVTELNSPNGSLQFVSKLIAKDPVMAAKALQLVNSPFFGLAQPMTQAEDAVLYLGIERTKALILLAKVFSQFDKMKCPGFMPEQLWLHSMGTANLARTLCREMIKDTRQADMAFTAGLLHDVGVLLLAANFSQEFSTVWAQKERRAGELHEIEREAFGAHHGELGAYVLGLWGLPLEIVRAVLFHHAPQEAGDSAFSVLTAVHVANAFEYEKRIPKFAEQADLLDHAYLGRIEVEHRLDAWRTLCDVPLPKAAVKSQRIQFLREAKGE